MKRKRGPHAAADAPAKIRKLDSAPAVSPTARVTHPVLSCAYPLVSTLRQYVLSKLPKGSKGRRRHVSHVGLGDDPEKELGAFLDRTLIGSAAVPSDGETRRRGVELATFTQELVKSTARSDIDTAGLCWEEIVHFVIWLLFKRSSQKARPTHILCHGFSRNPPYRAQAAHTAPMSSILGLYAVQRDSTTGFVKAPAWAKLLAILKAGGERILIDILLDCGVFEYSAADNGALMQVSGIPITAIAASGPQNASLAKSAPSHSTRGPGLLPHPQPKTRAAGDGTARGAASIHFLRSRIFYGKPNLNANGKVYYGLPHIHVFNRCKSAEDPRQTLHVMKYMFPHAFKLHNPFTSEVDRRETAMRLKDYTLREKEITHASLKLHPNVRDKVPKRFTTIAQMIQRIRKRIPRCSYTQLLDHHCRSELGNNSILVPSAQVAGTQKKITDFAVPHVAVSSFCKAVMSRLFPAECFGNEHGLRRLSKFIDKFVRLRKSETLSLGDLCKGMALTSFTWLCPPGMDPHSKLSRTDHASRTLLLCQFLYFVIDSVLMPLIRSHFHVTESNTDRLRLFYFRHDVWKQITEPTIARMKRSSTTELGAQQDPMFSSLVAAGADQPGSKLFKSAKFRLVPKHGSFRLITNLGHREQVKRFGRVVLDVSTNTKLWPVHQAMKAERARDRSRLGSSMFNKGEIGPRLQAYKHELLQRGWTPGTKLFFAKVDIQSCFDSIPQDKALGLLQDILAADAYDVQKYADVSPASIFRYDGGPGAGALHSRYAAHGTRARQGATTLTATDRALLPFAVRTPTAPVVTESLTRVHALLREHITQHTVRIGKKEYRQAQGIPQGSVVSTLLCNFFYAEYERVHLAFLQRPGTTMMRLIDDFLVVSTDRAVVDRFVKVMHAGNAEFGLTVKASKTVVNTGNSAQRFPFCGLEIDTRTLEVLKQAGGGGVAQHFDTLTVERSRQPGRVFHRKTLNGLKIQLQPLLLESSLNGAAAALTNLYTLLHSAAARAHAYTRSNPIADRVLVRTVTDLAALSARTMRSQHHRAAATSGPVPAHVHRERERQCLWLACMAFRDVFARKQTGHEELLRWLAGVLDGRRHQQQQQQQQQPALLERVVHRFETAVAAGR